MEILPLLAPDRSQLVRLYRTVASKLRKEGIYQWDLFYPNRYVIGGDLKRGTAFGIQDLEGIVGAVVVDRRQSAKYDGLPWTDRAGYPFCIHRLAVHPAHQGKGIGKRLLQFAEAHAQAGGATSMRLDVYTGNPSAVAIYHRAGYAEVGEITFPLRKVHYLCMEKQLEN